MKRKFVPLFCNIVFTFSIVFNKNFKTRKSGSFILKFTGVNNLYDILGTKINKSEICPQKLQKSYQNLKLKNQYHNYL